MVAGILTPERLPAIDWKAPWCSAPAVHGGALQGEAPARDVLNATAARLGVRNASGLPIRFVAAAAAGDAAYESHIARTGDVPTRDNLHDLFNALMWLTLPRAKARLNALQAEAIAAHGVGARRGPLRDAATLLDENGLLLVTRRADLVQALRVHDWRALFIANRAAWQRDVRALVFGHALLEKLSAPYKAITAHALALPLPADAQLAQIDACVAAMLDTSLTPRALMPLPVLGIPGWADNADAGYYDDAAVFRPARRHERGPGR
jgi:hypothetical protein